MKPEIELKESLLHIYKKEYGIKDEGYDDYALLVLQTPTDVNITQHCPRYMHMMKLVKDVQWAMERVGGPRVVVREHPKVAKQKGIKLPPLHTQINRCRYLITVNSNTAHEAMVANKDVIALGPHTYTSKK